MSPDTSPRARASAPSSCMTESVYQTYATGWRGLEFLMGYYPILDRAPKGRDEDDGFQLWIRRHDEYASR